MIVDDLCFIFLVFHWVWGSLGQNDASLAELTMMVRKASQTKQGICLVNNSQHILLGQTPKKIMWVKQQ